MELIEALCCFVRRVHNGGQKHSTLFIAAKELCAKHFACPSDASLRVSADCAPRELAPTEGDPVAAARKDR